MSPYTGKVIIGRWSSTYTDYYSPDLCVNDIRIYSYALSPQEIKEISRGLVGWWTGDSLDLKAKNLVNGKPISGTINQGTVSVADGIATINNTSGSWCRIICEDEEGSNATMANAGVAGKTITVSFDLYLISGTIPKIFICDSYRSMQIGDSNIKNKWQRCYLVYTHPG